MESVKNYLTSESERRYRKKYYLINRERILKRQKEYREEHKEKIAEYQKWYSMTHDRSEYNHDNYLKRKYGKMCLEKEGGHVEE